MGTTLVNYYRKMDDKDEHVPKVRQLWRWRKTMLTDLDSSTSVNRPSSMSVTPSLFYSAMSIAGRSLKSRITISPEHQSSAMSPPIPTS